MKTLYKSLFEIKLLHEFYLTDKNGDNIFGLSTQAERMDFLFNKYETNSEDINKDIGFEVPEDSIEVYKNNALKLLPTYSGCKVLIEVKAKKLASGYTTYEPVNKLSDDLSIPILLKRRSGRLNDISNQRLESNFSSSYFFTNDSLISGTRSFPYLTADISDYNASSMYEQGEVAKFGTNDYRSFYWDNSNTASWMPIKGKSFANANDRIVVSRNISYSFPRALNINKADFVLKDHLGARVQEFHFNTLKTFSKVQLSFDPKKIQFLSLDSVNEKGGYTLEVSANLGYNNTHKVLFYENEQELKESHGLICIKVKSSVNGYKLFDASGKLITRKNQFNITDPAAPVFEINFNSKNSYWRYINNKRRGLQSGLYADLLNSVDGTLISKEPKPLTSNTTLFRKPDSSLFYLPNPSDSQSILFENNKIYSDIMVPESDLFPLAP